jgi:excisionase family DNA binding protein
MSQADLRPPLDYDGAAEYLGTTPRHVRDLRATNRVPFVKLGGKVRFLPDDLDAFVLANRQEANDPAVQRLVDQAVAQGLPEKVTDPATLAKIAAILTSKKAS